MKVFLSMRIFGVSSLLLMCLASCDDPHSQKNDSPTVDLQLLSAGSNKIEMLIRVENAPTEWSFDLVRGVDLIQADQPGLSDSLVVFDTHLEENHDYAYRIDLLVDSIVVSSSAWLLTKTQSVWEVIVPQENILWPSLGQTASPMQHHDPQSTGRSQYAGPREGVLFSTLQAPTSDTGISIGYNNTIIVSSNEEPLYLTNMDFSGNELWNFQMDSESTPLVGSDSNIYVGGRTRFVSFSPSGDTLWSRPVHSMETLGINIDLEGNLYFIDGNHKLISMSNTGVINWQLQDERFLHWYDAAPTFSPDGQTIYLQGIDISVLAVDIQTQSVKWTFGDQTLLSSPVIDNQGNLYFIPGRYREPSEDRTLYSLNAEGQENWRFDFVANEIMDNTELTIDYQGNIYFATRNLYCLTYDGSLKWQVALDGRTVSPLICDFNNDIYVGVDNPYRIISVSNLGDINWTVTADSPLGVSPAITSDGTLFYPTWGMYPGRILVIK